MGIVKIGGHGDDDLGDFLAQAHLGVGLELGQDHGGNFRRTELFGLAVHLDFDTGVAVGAGDDLVRHPFEFLLDFIELASHEALDGVNGIAGVGDSLAFSGVADQAFPCFGEGHDGRRGTFAFGVFQNHRFAAFHDGHAGVSGSKINANYFCHIKKQIQEF